MRALTDLQTSILAAFERCGGDASLLEISDQFPGLTASQVLRVSRALEAKGRLVAYYTAIITPYGKWGEGEEWAYCGSLRFHLPSMTPIQELLRPSPPWFEG
jgi:hypothetical protein